jgi:hypothetical protein
MSGSGQIRPSRAIGDVSPIPPITAVSCSATNGRNVPLGDIASVYSITSSARASSEGGMSRPSDLAGTGTRRYVLSDEPRAFDQYGTFEYRGRIF